MSIAKIIRNRNRYESLTVIALCPKTTLCNLGARLRFWDQIVGRFVISVTTEPNPAGYNRFITNKTTGGCISLDKELAQYANDKNYGIVKTYKGYQLVYNGRVNPQVFKTKLLAIIYLGGVK